MCEKQQRKGGQSRINRESGGHEVRDIARDQIIQYLVNKIRIRFYSKCDRALHSFRQGSDRIQLTFYKAHFGCRELLKGCKCTTENCSSPSETWQLGLGSGRSGHICDNF